MDLYLRSLSNISQSAVPHLVKSLKVELNLESLSGASLCAVPLLTELTVMKLRVFNLYLF